MRDTSPPHDAQPRDEARGTSVRLGTSARRPRRRGGALSGVAVRAPPAGALRLQDGRGSAGGSRIVGGCDGPSRLPSTRGEPSRPPPDPPASVRAVKARLTWRTGRRPAPQRGGPMADGMARLSPRRSMLPLWQGDVVGNVESVQLQTNELHHGREIRHSRQREPMRDVETSGDAVSGWGCPGRYAAPPPARPAGPACRTGCRCAGRPPGRPFG